MIIYQIGEKDNADRDKNARKSRLYHGAVCVLVISIFCPHRLFTQAVRWPVSNMSGPFITWRCGQPPGLSWLKKLETYFKPAYTRKQFQDCAHVDDGNSGVDNDECDDDDDMMMVMMMILIFYDSVKVLININTISALITHQH